MKMSGNRTSVKAHRPKYFTIGCKETDIELTACSKTMVVKKNKLFVPGAQVEHVSKNNERINDVCVNILPGDIISIKDTDIHFSDKTILIESERGTSMNVHLPTLSESDMPFDGFPVYKRSPRIMKDTSETEVHLEKPRPLAQTEKRNILQLIMAPLMMTVITVGISLLLRRGILIVLALTGTVTSFVISAMKFVDDKKVFKLREELRDQTYQSYLMRKRKDIYHLYHMEKTTVRYQYPTILDITGMIRSYHPRIYERTSRDHDFLHISLGNSFQLSSVKVNLPIDELDDRSDSLEREALRLRDDFSVMEKPVIVDLRHFHLGLIGHKSAVHEVMKSIASQLTFFHSFHELELIVLFDRSYAKHFTWMRWYPHCKLHGINSTSLLCTEGARDQILGFLYGVLRERSQKVEKKGQCYLPHYVFLIDEPAWITDHPIMEYLGQAENLLGVTVVYAASVYSELPEYIGTIAQMTDCCQGTLLSSSRQACHMPFRTEHIQDVSLEWSARNLGVLQHMQGMSTQIPRQLSFFQLYGVTSPEQLAVAQRWKENDSSRSLAVLLGVRAAQEYIYLDIHERAHGPHGLIAGMTGSGKSEILQTYILSLAVNFHPHEIGFLLIDYKGGGMAELFRGLPHLLGTITNLDGAQANRALASIRSELERRQNIFSLCHVNHINGYTKLVKQGMADEPLPHLLLVSDEFAELKKEHPEFVSELISTARIGRSLGVHLILATQKPTGVVDEQIWSNTKFRLALQVQNESDSREIIKTPDAAKLTLPGRAYLQVGNNEIYELFQAAWSGAESDELLLNTRVDDRVYVLNELGQGKPVNKDLGGGHEYESDSRTQLEVTVSHIRECYKEYAPYSSVEVQKPWLPPLPEQVIAPKMENADSSYGVSLNIPLGIIDIPERQAQHPYAIELTHEGNILFVASPGYGKTFFLMTAALALAEQNHVCNMNLYILDFGNSGLALLDKLVHTADYVTADEVEKIGKLIRILKKELKLRKKQLAGKCAQNFRMYNEISKDKMKAIILIVDHIDAAQQLGYEVEDFFQHISKNGPGLGVFLIATAVRSANIKYGTYGNFKNKIAGFLFDETERCSIIGRSRCGQADIKGRALVKFEEMICEIQMYSIVPFSDNVEYNMNTEKMISDINRSANGEMAPRIPVIPTSLNYIELRKYPSVASDIYIGLEKEDVYVCGFELSRMPFVILGEAERGKTNALKIILDQMLGRSTVFVVDSKTMELYSYKSKQGVTYIESMTDIICMLDSIRASVRERIHVLKKQREIDPNLNFKYTGNQFQSMAVVVDDWDHFVGMVKDRTEEVSELLQDAVRVGICIILSAHSSKMKGFDGLSRFAKQATDGLLVGNPGMTGMFQVGTLKELPAMKDGLLFRGGSYKRVRIPLHQADLDDNCER